MVRGLGALLEPLIRWRFNASDVHYGIAAKGVEEIQAKVSKFLENPLIDRWIITTALRQARAAVAKDVAPSVQGSISLKMLLKPPLKAWEGHWGNTDTPAGWRSLSEEDADYLCGGWNEYEMTRLGSIIGAWALEVAGEIREIIECWSGRFWPQDLYGRDCQPYAECQTFYRFKVADHREGRVYPHLEQAVRGKGGYPVDAVLEESLAWWLGFDDIDDPFFTYSDLLMAAKRAWQLEITDAEPVIAGRGNRSDEAEPQ
jgi:hypothetical protein